MRFVLRDSDTGEFYRSSEVWVNNVSEATDFGAMQCALEVREEITRKNIELMATDEAGRHRWGVKLWKNGHS